MDSLGWNSCFECRGQCGHGLRNRKTFPNGSGLEDSSSNGHPPRQWPTKGEVLGAIPKDCLKKELGSLTAGFFDVFSNHSSLGGAFPSCFWAHLVLSSHEFFGMLLPVFLGLHFVVRKEPNSGGGVAGLAFAI